ncbi:EamA family transporter [Streptomyces sp. NPDC002835]
MGPVTTETARIATTDAPVGTDAPPLPGTRPAPAPHRVPGAVLVLVAMVVLHTGSALATELFHSLGPAGTTWLRLTFAAVFLAVFTGRSLWRTLRKTPRRDLLATCLLGGASAGMMLLFSEAAARLPLGTATALEFLGPLTVAVFASSRLKELAWLGLAGAGVVLLTSPWTGGTSPTGVLFGLGSAACWALYVVGTAHVGSRFSAPHALAVSLAVAAVAAAPFGAPGALAALTWQTAAAGAGIAVLMPLVPFLLEMQALQRIGKTTYGTLAGLEPAVSLVAGMVLIAQTPGVLQIAGTALVVAAGIGATRAEARR